MGVASDGTSTPEITTVDVTSTPGEDAATSGARYDQEVDVAAVLPHDLHGLGLFGSSGTGDPDHETRHHDHGGAEVSKARHHLPQGTRKCSELSSTP